MMEVNKNNQYAMKCYKKRYNNDVEFRKREVERISNTNKNKYANDPEYRQKCKDYVKAYRAKLKELKTFQIKTLEIL